jgi:hypothetical protein
LIQYNTIQYRRINKCIPTPKLNYLFVFLFGVAQILFSHHSTNNVLFFKKFKFKNNITFLSWVSKQLDTTDLEADGDDVGDDVNAVDVIIIDESGWDHGVDQLQQHKSCRDWFWGLLFLLQFIVVFTISIIGIRNMIKQGYVVLCYTVYCCKFLCFIIF